MVDAARLSFRKAAGTTCRQRWTDSVSGNSCNLSNIANFIKGQARTSLRLDLGITNCLVWQLLSVMPACICLIGFKYAQPFLISCMISFVGGTRNSPEYYNHSLGLIATAALIYVGIAVSTVRCTHPLPVNHDAPRWTSRTHF